MPKFLVIILRVLFVVVVYFGIAFVFLYFFDRTLRGTSSLVIISSAWLLSGTFFKKKKPVEVPTDVKPYSDYKPNKVD